MVVGPWRMVWKSRAARGLMGCELSKTFATSALLVSKTLTGLGSGLGVRACSKVSCGLTAFVHFGGQEGIAAIGCCHMG
eukprot:396463-Rhodomonas_salina.2